MITVGLIREGKVPIDKRVPITPIQAVQLQHSFDHVKVVVQSSSVRCFSDEEYQKKGISVVEDVSNCDILLGVKEVPIAELIEGKTYFFFSHTTKQQSYNRALLQSVIEKKIRLIDYEGLTNKNDHRIVAFGRYAGIVGAYNGIKTYGDRYNLFNLRPANKCYDLEDLKTEFEKVKLPPVKIVITGSGRVARGAMEVLDQMNIKQVTPEDFLNADFSHAIYAQLNMDDYNSTIDGSDYSHDAFHEFPEKYKGDFLKYTQTADILIAGAFWDPRAPVLFTREEATRKDFKIKVIADITCDIEGSIPSTLRASTIDDPIYNYSPLDGLEKAALSNERNITVMAVDNLPCELAINASFDFGNQLLNNVLPHLFDGDKQEVIKRATIAENGQLTNKYSYLQSFLEGK